MDKFRVWHREAKEMLYDDNLGDCFRWLNEGQPVDIMLPAGIKDINMVDIYEGDYLKEKFNVHVWIYEVTKFELFGNNLYLKLKYRNFKNNSNDDFDVSTKTNWGDYYSDNDGSFYTRGMLSQLSDGKSHYEIIGNKYNYKI